MTDGFNDKELIARLRSKRQKGNRFDSLEYEAADRIEQLVATNEALINERDSLLAGHRVLNIGGARLQDRAETAEAKLAKAAEALEALIQLAHDCEKELTEDLHHVDFCGESEPLTKARTTLAEIKEESHE